MDDKIQQQILDELKKISKNLSFENVQASHTPKQTFAEALFNHIETINENIEKFHNRLQKVEELLKK